ncbi:hypothetical protein [Paeniglutamicibacter antarcticus]|uniref:Uncharacterized protein n=1 Tax=Paeniglutamicibacter antarcticus TaxID=494023 RepID=A0ABP9TL71_9MICC
MVQVVGSGKMFRLGLVLAIFGAVFQVFASPLLNWMINENSFSNPGLGIALGFIAVIQQGAFLGGLFLLAGSFVVRSAEEAVAAVHNKNGFTEHSPQD